MRITIQENGVEKDVTGLIGSAELSGAYNQACRTLSFSLVQGEGLERVETALIQPARIYEPDSLLFSGYVFKRSHDASANAVDIVCRDRGIFLKKNKASYSFSGRTPEEITRVLAKDFGIPTGSIAETGVGVNRLFRGNDLYSIIMTAYTEAAAVTGKKYIIRFSGDNLCVYEKGKTGNIFLSDTKDILAAKYAESLENTVTQAAIYDKNDNFVRTVQNDALAGVYGIMREYVKEKTGKDAVREANKILRERGIERQAVIENFGDSRLLTGDTVIIREPGTGLYGKFFIDEDLHRWKNGIYTNRLTLSFENMMDEQDVGTANKDAESAADLEFKSSASSDTEKLVDAAKAEVGTKSGEKYRKWYYGGDNNNAWCAIFVSWCANKAGILTKKVPRFAWCDSGKEWFVQKGKWKNGNTKPKKGWIVFFQYNTGSLDHTGIVTSVSDDSFKTVEGNASSSVQERTYKVGYRTIHGFGVVE